MTETKFQYGEKSLVVTPYGSLSQMHPVKTTCNLCGFEELALCEKWLARFSTYCLIPIKQYVENLATGPSNRVSFRLIELRGIHRRCIVKLGF